MSLEGLDLNSVWFVLIGVLFAGYAILDGFDLGVGALHLFTKTDDDRRIMLNAIGPVWGGNEVWLVTGGGALFAAFPDVYATQTATTASSLGSHPAGPKRKIGGRRSKRSWRLSQSRAIWRHGESGVGWGECGGTFQRFASPLPLIC